MTATIDANILLYASGTSGPLADPAAAFLDRITRGPEIVTLFWPAVLAYIRIGTNAGVSDFPLTLTEATSNIDALLGLEHVRVAGERERFWRAFVPTATEAHATGNLISDAHIVALMREHGVGTIWTHDRDFRKFDGIEVRDPFA